MSSIDLKAGFYNVPFDESTQLKTVFTTPLGRYKWKRMPFGLNQAPAHFQWVMQRVLGPKSNVYLDDIQVSEDEVQACLANTVDAIRRIA